MIEVNKKYNDKFMQRANDLSEIAYVGGKGLPIGCVIVKNGDIIGEGHNEIFHRNNPTSHAEMVAIENACNQTGNLQLEGCEMYTTLEPCPMCLGAIYWAKLDVVYFANTNEDASEVGFSDNFIFEELNKPPEKRKIQILNMTNSNANRILKEWALKNIPALQPWENSENSN
jgi:tRNA(Arg) A34 adenosine deaminase TadA